MRTLREAVEDAKNRHIAIGHFNVSDSTQLNTIAETARELGVPVIIGVSEGERKFIGVRQVAAIIRTFRDVGHEIYLNADHTYSFALCKEAIDMGFDAVIFDGSELPLEENIAKTKEVVTYARATGRDVLVEGELGYIGRSSKLLDAIPEGAGLEKTTPETAQRFTTESGADLLAPSVGNIHGMLKDMPNPRLDAERVASLRATVNTPLVLHGGSGSSEEDFRAAIKAGIAIVHINTEIRVAYRTGIQQGLKSEEIAPYKYLAEGGQIMKAVVKAKLELFTNP